MRILYLDLDTLRPDHLGCYGYHRDTSPNIDRIAAQGVRFDNTYCSDAPCLPSRAALMTGRFGIHTGVVGHGGTCADMRLEGPARGFRDRLVVHLPAGLLKQAGLHTASIGPFAERHSAWWFYAGFHEMYNTGLGGMESAEDVTPTVLDWIARNAAKDNWFLHVNYWDPHTPYRAPAEFGNPFADDPLPAWLTPEVLAQHRRHVGPHGAREPSCSTATSPALAAPPGRAARHGRPAPLHRRLRLRHPLHGRAHRPALRGAGRGRRDGRPGDHRQLRPRREPGRAGHLRRARHGRPDHLPHPADRPLAGRRAAAPTAACTTTSTWPDAGGTARPAGQPHWDGASFAPAISAGPIAGASISWSASAPRLPAQRALGRWLYMRTYHDGYHLFPDEMLFDVAADPHEQHDLAAARPDLCAQGCAT